MIAAVTCVHSIRSPGLSLSLDYDSGGRLVAITDGDGNITVVERAGASPTGILGPYGQRTGLTLTATTIWRTSPTRLESPLRSRMW
jgi:YD repeat-containing protein